MHPSGDRQLPPVVSRALEVAAERPRECGFFFDFDGTLAPIQDDPESVQPAAGVLGSLGQLVAVAGRVAIVSARPAAFLRSRFASLSGVALHGLYGLERSDAAGEVVTEPEAVPWIPVIAELAERARAELPPQVLVEFKRLSVALHYRAAPELRDEVEAWAERARAEVGLRAQTGRMVVELKPPVERDKGAVIAGELSGLASAWYFGDDVGDLPAFAAVARRQATGDGFAGVRVAVANPETGGQVTAAADIVIDSPAAVPTLLAEVLAAARSERSG
jgi:trehalose 6-phosphate phosphatase